MALRSVEIREGVRGWRIQGESPNYVYQNVIAVTYLERDYEKAVTHFETLRGQIDLSVPADAERHATCTYCKNVTTVRSFYNIQPWSASDDDYCGCRGWD